MKRSEKGRVLLKGTIVGPTTGVLVLDRLIPHLAAEAELRATTQ